jgi:hypothetical protein
MPDLSRKGLSALGLCHRRILHDMPGYGPHDGNRHRTDGADERVMNDEERWARIEALQSTLTLAQQGIKDRVWKALCEELYDFEKAWAELARLIDDVNPTPLETGEEKVLSS